MLICALSDRQYVQHFMTEKKLKTARRTQKERRSAAEAALLDAAEKLFAERGPQRTTLADIGVSAGYSRGHAAFCFGTKDRFIKRMGEHLRERFLREASAVLDDGLNGREKILKIADFYMLSAVSAPQYVRAFFTLWGSAMSEKAGSAVAEYDEETREILASWIREGQREGSITRNISAKASAFLLLGLLRGATGQMIIAPNKITKRALRKECRKIFELALPER